MAISGFIFIILCIALAGIGFGLYSQYERPSPVQRGKFAHYSYVSFMLANVLAWVFMPFFLIPGSILFGVGSVFTMICLPMRDETIFDEVTF